jgi:hypothetical protein
MDVNRFIFHFRPQCLPKLPRIAGPGEFCDNLRLQLVPRQLEPASLPSLSGAYGKESKKGNSKLAIRTVKDDIDLRQCEVSRGLSIGRDFLFEYESSKERVPSAGLSERGFWPDRSSIPL